MNKDSRIYVAGHRGLVGSAIIRLMKKEGYSNLITRTHKKLDLTDQRRVQSFFSKEKPEYVFLAAAKVGGIHANDKYRGQFIYENLQIQNNLIHQSYIHGVKKLLFLGSSCIYPKLCPQPMKEEHLLTGPLEPTNDAYAIAKIAGIKMCESYNTQYGTDFISVMPTNLYGPNDNFDLETSHVLPALIRKFHEAKVDQSESVILWGSGLPYREFLHVDDMAEACFFLMNKEKSIEMVNVGTGKDISIGDLAELIKDIVGFEGEIVLDSSKPDGTPKKLLDVSKLESLGWKAKTSLRHGIERTYRWYYSHT